MNDNPTIWLPFQPQSVSSLPNGPAYHFWDGSSTLPGDPKDVQFLVGPPVPGAEKVLGEVLPRTPRLKVLQLLSSGFDHIEPLLDTLPPGVRVSTARGVHGDTTAEMAVTLLLALFRGLDQFREQQDARRWAPKSLKTLANSRVLIIGHGAVGGAVAARLQPFGCEVIAVARSARVTRSSNVHSVAELRALLPTVDAVVICAPLTEETRGMFDATALALLKDDAMLVNVARGELVDTDALIDEVRRGRLRAALDVVDPEPLPSHHPLWHLPGVLVTPHVAAFTNAFIPTSKAFLGKQVRNFVDGEVMANVVLTTGGR